MADNANMPNFFILGAAKAGTTSLYEYLRSHPDIFLSAVKEPQFFCHDRLYALGFEWYLETHFADSMGYLARGEATPHYLYFEKAAQRIALHIPRDNQRFIVIMRDPVMRAYSLYWNMVHEGMEDRSFEEAIRLEGGDRGTRVAEQDCTLLGSYISSSCYARQIRRYLAYFDRSQFQFVFFEDLVADAAGTLSTIYDFLRVSTAVPAPAGRAFNTARAPRSQLLHGFLRKPNPLKRRIGRLLTARQKYGIANLILQLNRRKVGYPPMDSELETCLRERFAADVLDLQDLTGRDLSVWLPTR